MFFFLENIGQSEKISTQAVGYEIRENHKTIFCVSDLKCKKKQNIVILSISNFIIQLNILF